MRPLEGDEEALAALLARAGLSRAAARVLAALARGAPASASELGEATALSRQDAGDGARELELLGVARVERVPTRGRPMHRYHLARDAGDAISQLVAKRREALAEELRALDELEARVAR